MTKVFSKNKNDFYDDYAHHPTEISSILEGVHKVNPKRKIISVFEPHRYSRVIYLKNQFSKCFSKSKSVILCPLYAAATKKITNLISLNLQILLLTIQKLKL